MLCSLSGCQRDLRLETVLEETLGSPFALFPPFSVLAPTLIIIYDIVVMNGEEDFDGEALKHWRESLGESRQWLADECGVSARTVEAWEQGRRQPGGAARRLLVQLMRLKQTNGKKNDH